MTNAAVSRSRSRLSWAIVRLITAAALFIAIVVQLGATIAYAQSQSQHLVTAVVNHLSYFTVMSTTAGTIVLAIGGVWLLRHTRTDAMEPRWLSTLFLCIGSAVVITGIVYNLLLRNDGVPDPDTLVWASEIKHVLAPLVFAVDLVLHIARRPLRWSDAALALIFPVAWAVYTLSRGEFITDPLTGNPWWYPYGFVNPHGAGYGSVALYVVAIAALLAAVAALSVWASRRNRGRAQAGKES